MTVMAAYFFEEKTKEANYFFAYSLKAFLITVSGSAELEPWTPVAAVVVAVVVVVVDVVVAVASISGLQIKKKLKLK